MACAPCFSRMFEDLFDKLDAHGMSSGLNVETALGFLEVTMGDKVHIKARTGLLKRNLTSLTGLAMLTAEVSR